MKSLFAAFVIVGCALSFASASDCSAFVQPGNGGFLVENTNFYVPGKWKKSFSKNYRVINVVAQFDPFPISRIYFGVD